MKTASHPKYFLLLLLTLGLALGPALRADEAPPAPPAAPAEPEKQPAAVDAEAQDKAESTDDDKSSVEEHKAATDEKSAAEKEKTGRKSSGKKLRRQHHGSGNERVSFGSGSTLAAGEEADAVVSIFGSSTSAGNVGDAVVSVIGNSRVEGGAVGDAVVSVLGSTYVNGEVHGEVVAVLGNVELGPRAIVHGEVVCIGGHVTRDGAAVVNGNVQNIAVAGRHFDFGGLTTWVTECLLYGRPLAFDRNLLWAWCIAFAFLAFYAVVALVAPSGVNKCVETLEQNPGSTLLASLLTLLLTPVAFILLAVTLFIVVGFVLIPALSLGLFLASLFGKVVILAWLGRRFTRLLGDGAIAHPVVGVLLGGAVVLLLYTVPILGFITYKALGILGLGTVVYTLIMQFKANRAARPVPAPQAAATTPVPAVPPAAAGGETMPAADLPPVISAAPAVVSAATLPRVGFWLRLVASFLDMVLLGIVTGMSSAIFHGWLSPGGSLPFWFAVYCVIMWATKGTTIGGIICGLKVVRLDDRPIDWGVAIVRALGGFLSLAVAGLGFVWVAFDDDRQSWHDKIAGTTIVRVPKGTALM
jgi:uncharacterized RDD family membrane protein YckC